MTDLHNTFDFLKALKEHNDRDWMAENKKWYQQVKKEVEQLVAALIGEISRFDEGITGLTPKDCMFRINRDIRFSKDKRPYKENFGAAITEGGKKSPMPTYYIHLEPGNSFVAGGIYMPETEVLKKIRQEIDYNPEELKKIVEDAEFKKTFGELTGERLKTAPKGYPKDHPNIELLRLKSIIVTNDYTDEQVLSNDFFDHVIHDFKVLHPMNQYLGVAVS